MRAPDTPPYLRLRVASLVARYVHPKQAAAGRPKIMVEDPIGFSIDPALAMELRDAKSRYDILSRKSYTHREDYERESPGLGLRRLQAACNARAHLCGVKKNTAIAIKSGWRSCLGSVARGGD
jgi:hypothetical protein